MTKEEFVPIYMAKREAIVEEMQDLEQSPRMKVRLHALHVALKDGDDELASFLGVVHAESGGNGK